MKKSIPSIFILALISCESDISPRAEEFRLPTEYNSPQVISLPYHGGGIKLEVIDDLIEWQLRGRLYYIDNQSIFSGIGNKLYKTYDGGKNWELKFTSPGTNSITSQVVFVKNNPNIGFVGGGLTGRLGGVDKDGWIARTKDKGESWTLVYKNLELGVHSIYPIVSNPGIVIASVGKAYRAQAIIRSEDNGDTWRTVYEGDKAGDIIPLTDQYLYTYGGLLSTDYGLTWSEVSIESVRYLRGIHLLTQRGGVISGIGYDVKTIEDNSGTQVFQISFNAETLAVTESRLAFTSDKVQLDWLNIISGNKAPLMGEYYDRDEDGILMVYPNGSKWQPLLLNGDSFNPPYQGATWWVDGVTCFDWGCYLYVGCYASDLASYSRLIKLTYE